MKHTFQKYWRLFWYFRRLRLMAMFEYRADFIFWALVSAMWTIFNFFFFGLIVNVKNGIGEWSIPQLYTLFSIFTILDAITWSWFYPTMSKYTTSIFDGSFSNWLNKPVSLPFVIMAQENNYNNFLRAIIGLVALIWGVNQLTTPPTLPQWLLFILMFTCSSVFLYSFWFFIATLSFWVEKLDNINEIIPGIRRIWQFPKEIYSGPFSTLFTVILPLGLITSLPTEALTGKAEFKWLCFFIIFTVSSFVLSQMFFQVSVKKYTSVGN